MTRRDDDLIGIDTEGSVYRDPLVDLIDEMRELGRGPAPAPSPALAALLRGGAPVSRLALHPVRRVTGALLAAASIAVVVAAETHDLPAPAQRVVSNVIDHLSPLHWNGIAHIPSPPRTQPVRADPGTVHRIVLHPRAPVRPRPALAPVLASAHVVSTRVAVAHRSAHPVARLKLGAHARRVSRARAALRHKRMARLIARRHGSWRGSGSWSGWPQRWASEAREWNRASQQRHHRHVAPNRSSHHHHGHHVRRRA